MKVLIFSLGLMFALMTTIVNAADPQPKDCVSVETKDGFTLLTNRCTQSINITWYYDGACAAGCTKKLASKVYVYEELFKEPYVLGACYSPEKVDANWKGFGQATCQ
jgi:hypothetical protein